MKLKFFFSLLVFVLLIKIVAAPDGSEVIHNARPEIRLEYEEQVLLQNASLFYIAPFLEPVFIGLINRSEEGGKTWIFIPAMSLMNKDYFLLVIVTDLVGNPTETRKPFTIEVNVTDILIVEPKIGYSSTRTFNLTIETWWEGEPEKTQCKWWDEREPIERFDQPGLNSFDLTTHEGARHTLVNFRHPFDESHPYHIYIICNDSLGRFNQQDFDFYWDTHAPSITSVSFFPSPVKERPLQSDLNIQANEPVICKYSRDDGPITALENYDPFDFYAFTRDYTQTIVLPEPEDEYAAHRFKLECEDRAGWPAPLQTIDLIINLSIPLEVSIISPLRYTSETEINLVLETNKDAYCQYKMSDEPDYRDTSTNVYNWAKNHTAFIGTFANGQTGSIDIRCFSAKQEKIITGYQFTVDQSGPSAVNISGPSVICTKDKIQFKTPLTFSATDTQSGIDHYDFQVLSAAGVIVNWTESGGTVTTIERDVAGRPFNFTEKETFSFFVRAVNGAGLEGPLNSFNVRYDPTALECLETTPPSITLLKEAIDGAIQVTVQCSDAESGCDETSFMYGTAATQEDCVANLPLPSPFTKTLYSSQYFCYEVKDLAGNIAKGAEFIEVPTVTECELDQDRDGYGLGCPAGLDCNDKDAEIFENCPNGCVVDSDGDGYGLGCDAGLDCDDLDEAIFENCPNGCIADNDGDGYGQGCDAGPDCNGLSANLTTVCPNACVSDNDGDGYGLGCTLGLDCDGEDPEIYYDCLNACISDNDGDGSGLGCDAGLDCDGENSGLTITCPNHCIADNDGDGYGLGCDDGFDCNGEDPSFNTECPNGCTIDSDGDGSGIGCADGFDCNDFDPARFTGCDSLCVQDTDGDAAGLGCEESDCDDYVPTVGPEACTTQCTFDNDCDRIGDEWEERYGLDPNNPDDALLDPDEDGRHNLQEFRDGTDPTVYDIAELDSDSDEMPDSWEIVNELNAYDPADALGDSGDWDGLLNVEEFKAGSDPNSPDSDNDGIFDGGERTSGTDPTDPTDYPLDADGNGIADDWEQTYCGGTCIRDSDADNDGLTAFEEYNYNTDPASPDSDDDGIADGGERTSGYDPKDQTNTPVDNDGDGVGDEWELVRGMDPTYAGDASLDFDQDGVINLDEYKRNLDPNEPVAVPPPIKKPRIIPWILLLLGIAFTLGGSGWLIYKKYYVAKPAPPVPGVPPGAPPPPGLTPEQLAERARLEAQRRAAAEARARAERAARARAVAAARERAEKRRKVFEAFVPAKPPKPPEKPPAVPPEKAPPKPAAPPAKPPEVVEEWVPIEKLAKPKKVVKKPPVKPPKKAEEIERLEELIEKKPPKKKKKEEDIFEKLSKAVGVKLREKSLAELRELMVKKKTPAEITDMFVGLSKRKEFTVEVFQTIVKELIDTGKITGSDVKAVGIDLMSKGLITKAQLAKVFFNLGIKG